MTASGYFFVPFSKPTDSRERKELRYAATKAHLARAAHARRRRQNGASQRMHDAVVIDSLDHRYIQEVIRSQRTSPFQDIADSWSAPLRAWCGNRDPFGTQLVNVTPLLNHAVAFVRFHLVKSWSPSFVFQLCSGPVRHCPLLETRGNVLGLRPARWSWCLLLSTPGALWAAVAAMLPLMVSMNEDLATELRILGLELKAGSFSQIRTTLGRTIAESQPSTALIYHIKALFRGSCMAGDRHSARLYADMLRTFLERVPHGQVDNVTRVALWSDAVPALLQMRLPLVDPAEWMPDTLTSLWHAAERSLKHAQQLHIDLPAVVKHPVLRAALEHLKRSLCIIKLHAISDSAEDIQHTEQLFYWIVSKAEYHICGLLHLYFSYMSIIASEVSTNFDSERYYTAATSLALLHLMQKSFCEITQSSGIDLNESAFVIQPAIRHAVELAAGHCHETVSSRFRDLHFWLLYVGAYSEERLLVSRSEKVVLAQTTASLRPEVPTDSQWFHNQLMKHAQSRGLYYWVDARRVLENFVLNETIKPGGELWFEKTTCRRKL